MSKFVKVQEAKASDLTPSGRPKDYTMNGAQFQHLYFNGLFQMIIKGATVTNKEKNGKPDPKLITPFNDPLIVGGLKEMDTALMQGAYQHRNELSIPQFDPNNPGAMYRGIFFKPTDPDTGVVQEGSDWLMAHKMNGQSKFDFRLEDGKTQSVNYLDLVGKSLTISLVFSARIYKSKGPWNPMQPKPMLAQPMVRSCMILDMTERTVDQTDSDMVKEYLAQNPDAISNLASQLRNLKSASANMFAPKAEASDADSGEVIFQESQMPTVPQKDSPPSQRSPQTQQEPPKSEPITISASQVSSGLNMPQSGWQQTPQQIGLPQPGQQQTNWQSQQGQQTLNFSGQPQNQSQITLQKI